MRVWKPLATIGLAAAPFAAASGQVSVEAGPRITIPSLGNANHMVAVLKRQEVVRALHLTIKQQSELEDVLKNPPLKVSLTRGPEEASDPEALKRQVEEQVVRQQMGLEERIKSVLTPEQYRRLVEVTLQWRGLIALGDPAIAESMKITNENRADISRMVAEYNRKKSEIMMEYAQVNEQPTGNGVARMVRLDSSRFTQPGTEGYKRLSALKADAEARILAVLSAAEKETWTRALGEPFTFRKDIPGNRF